MQVNVNGQMREMTLEQAQAYWASTSTQMSGQAPTPSTRVGSYVNVNAGCSPPAYGPFDPAPWPPKSSCIIAGLGYPCLPEGYPAPNSGYYDKPPLCPDGTPMQACPNACPGMPFNAAAFPGVTPVNPVPSYVRSPGTIASYVPPPPLAAPAQTYQTPSNQTVAPTVQPQTQAPATVVSNAVPAYVPTTGAMNVPGVTPTGAGVGVYAPGTATGPVVVAPEGQGAMILAALGIVAVLLILKG